MCGPMLRAAGQLVPLPATSGPVRCGGRALVLWPGSPGSPIGGRGPTSAGWLAGRVLEELLAVVGLGTAPVAAADVPADAVVVGRPGRRMPQVAVVQDDVAAFRVDGGLAGDLVEAERHLDRSRIVGVAAGWAGVVRDLDVVDVAVGRRGRPVVAAGDDAQEPVRRARAVEVEGEGEPWPDVDAGHRLPVGVPADPGVAGLPARPGVLVDDTGLF